MDGVLRLHQTDPRELHDVWALVLPGLEKVREHAGSYWLPEDVYHAIRAGNSTLHLGYLGEDYAGFMVLTLVDHFDGRILHIWCVYSNGTCDDVVARALPDLEVYARQHNARRLTMWSPRNWERKLKPFGFKSAHTEYVKEL